MMEIMLGSLRERIRRKDIYVMMALGVLFAMFCMSGSTTISIDGEEVADTKTLLSLVSNVIGVVGGSIAIAVSLSTIPREYELRTSHLIWIRGVSQRSYHGQLALANLLISLAGLLVMYMALVIITLFKGETGLILKVLPAFFLYAMGTAGVSLFTSALSLVLPTFLTGLLAIVIMLIGTTHPLLESLADMVSDMAGRVLDGILWIAPDLYSVNKQGMNFLLGKDLEAKYIWTGVIFCFVCVAFICYYRKKEA